MNIKKTTKLDKISKIIMTCSIIAFAASLFIQMYMCNQMAIKNSELRSISEKRKDLATEISTLSYEDESLSSLKYVDTHAKEMGFVKLNSKILSLSQASSKTASISQR